MKLAPFDPVMDFVPQSDGSVVCAKTGQVAAITNANSGPLYPWWEGARKFHPIEGQRSNFIAESTLDDAAALATWTAESGLTATLGDYVGESSYEVELACGASAKNFYRLINPGTISFFTSYLIRTPSGAAPTDADVKVLFAGAAYSPTFTPMGGGWYAASYRATGSNSSYGLNVQANKTIYVCKPQAEEGYARTRYIPTSGATATEQGGVAVFPWGDYESGAGGLACRSEKGRYNYMPNSDFSAWTGDLPDGVTESAVGGDLTVVNSEVDGPPGFPGSFLRLDVTCGASPGGQHALYYRSAAASFAAGDFPLLSWVVRGDFSFVISADVYYVFEDAADSYLGVYQSGLTFSGAEDWTRFAFPTAAAKAAPAGTDHIKVIVRFYLVADTSGWCEIGAFMAEETGQADYSGPAHSYIPTSGANVGSRTQTGVRVADHSALSKVQGTFIVVVDDATRNDSHTRYIDWAYNSTNRILIYRSNAGTIYMMTLNAGATHHRYLTTADVGPCVIAGTWENGEDNNLYVDGVPAVSSSGLPYTTIAETMANLGLGTSYSAGTDSAIGPFARFVAYDKVLTETEIASVTADLLKQLGPSTMQLAAAGVL